MDISSASVFEEIIYLSKFVDFPNNRFQSKNRGGGGALFSYIIALHICKGRIKHIAVEVLGIFLNNQTIFRFEVGLSHINSIVNFRICNYFKFWQKTCIHKVKGCLDQKHFARQVRIICNNNSYYFFSINMFLNFIKLLVKSDIL